MESKKTVIFLIYASITIAAALPDITLVSSRYVQKGQPIRLECSSDNVPLGYSAEFLADSRTVTNIKNDSGSCYKTINNQKCEQDICMCSKNGKSYVLFYRSYSAESYITFMCAMKFPGNTAQISDEVRVTIIDIPTPRIYTEDDMPFISGSSINIACLTDKTATSFNMRWECAQFKNDVKMSGNDTSVWSVLRLKLDSSYNNEQCICAVQSKHCDFEVSCYITLQITDKPILSMRRQFFCNSSRPIAIPCSVKGEMKTFGFFEWNHSMNGSYIRSIPDDSSTDVSVILIEDCSYQDAGDYTCSVWNQSMNETITSNKTTTLLVYGPPVIKQKNVQNHLMGSTFSLYVYTSNSLESVKWYCDKKELTPSDETEISLEQTDMQMDFHNKVLVVSGYKACITIRSEKCPVGRYNVCVKNEYAVKCVDFESTKEYGLTSKVPINFIVPIGLFCIVVVVIISTTIMVKRWKTRSTVVLPRDNEVTSRHHIANNQRTRDVNQQTETAQQSVQTESQNNNVLQVNNTEQQDDDGYELPARPYSTLLPYQSSRVNRETTNDYLDVEPDLDSSTCSTGSSDYYEKVQ